MAAPRGGRTGWAVGRHFEAGMGLGLMDVEDVGTGGASAVPVKTLMGACIGGYI